MTPQQADHFTLVFGSVRTTTRAVFGAKERHTPIGDHGIKRTWNGRAKKSRPSFGTLYSIELSNGGPAVWLPDIERLETEESFVFYSSLWKTATFGRNESEMDLPRDIAPGAFAARDLMNPRIRVPIEAAGRRVAISARSALTLVLWRPAMRVVLASWDAGADRTGREQQWSLRLEEFSA